MGTKHQTTIDLSAVIVNIKDGRPQILVAAPQGGAPPALPSGPFETQHRTLEQALRAWVHEASGADLDYVEQLYTFADRDRAYGDRRFVSIGYLALADKLRDHPRMMDWYGFFPWEDHRAGVPEKLFALIHKHLQVWKNAAPSGALRRAREARIRATFPKDRAAWNDELVLQRYELLWEAGLIAEALRETKGSPALPSLAMAYDHRRILATGIARLRVKIKYRPVVFELLPERFTLLQLQETVEALAGVRVHKQNFRRLVLSQGLVEETRALTQTARGRPAKLFSFRPEVLEERAAAGTKLPRLS